MYKNVDIKEEVDGVRVKYEIHQQGTEKIFKTDSLEPLDIEYGKGEWVAETIEDARQMAIDFANGVS